MSVLNLNNRVERDFKNIKLARGSLWEHVADKDSLLEQRKAMVLPFLMREASVPLTARYTRLSIEKVRLTKASLRKNSELFVSTGRSFSYYEMLRSQIDSPTNITGMLDIGWQLVERGVITSDVSYWKVMHEKIFTENPFLLPPGFMERLILEGFLVAQLKGRAKLDTAIRRVILEGGLGERFDSGFAFFSEAAPRIKQELGK